MAEKTEQNWYPQKTSKNEAQGVPELTQNGSEFIEKLSEIEKSGPKNWKLSGQFFDDFLGSQKTFSRRVWDRNPL